MTNSNFAKHLPGVKVHKSFKDAIANITEDLEKQHFEVLAQVKAEAKKAAAKLSRARADRNVRR